MPRATLECSCLQRLIAAVTEYSTHCSVNDGNVMIHLSHIPVGIFGLRISVEIALGPGHVQGSGELVLQYRIVRVARLPGWLIGGLVDWIARHIKHPVVHLGHGKIHIFLDRVQIGPQALTGVVQITEFRVPDGGAACSLTFTLKE
ncbi:MAG: hypothetical protein ABSE73_08495 [Planctomycetota bacterium]